jgi:hypothetical protein
MTTEDGKTIVRRCLKCRREFRDGRWGRPAHETCGRCGGSGLVGTDELYPGGPLQLSTCQDCSARRRTERYSDTYCPDCAGQAGADADASLKRMGFTDREIADASFLKKLTHQCGMRLDIADETENSLYRATLWRMEDGRIIGTALGTSPGNAAVLAIRSGLAS